MLVFGSSERQQRHAARPFNGNGEQSLMPGAVSRDPARRHLSPFGDELSYHSEIFVIDPQRFIGAKTAHLSPKHRPAARPSLFIVRSLPVRPRASIHKLCHCIAIPLFRPSPFMMFLFFVSGVELREWPEGISLIKFRYRIVAD